MATKQRKPKKTHPAKDWQWDLRAGSSAFHPASVDRFQQLAPKRYVPVSSSDTTERKRIVKDVLSVGRYVAGDNVFEPDRATLLDLAENFNQMLAAGREIFLCWGHGTPGGVGVDARDLISPIDQVFVEGDTLYCSAYVPPQTAIDLQTKQAKVSARIRCDYQDGSGTTYPIALLHVAVVDHPIVGGQSNFLDLGANMAPPPFAKKKPKAKPDPTEQADAENPEEDAAPDEEADAPLGGGVIGKIAQLLELLGMALPDQVTSENLEVVLDTLIANAQGQEEEQVDEAPADPGLQMYGETDMSQTVTKPDNKTLDLAQVSAAIKEAIDLAVVPLKDTITVLSNKLAAKESEEQKAREAAYASGVEYLLSNGHVTPAAKEDLVALGAAHGYDLAILKPFASLHSIDLGSLTQRGASAAPPVVKTSTPGCYSKPDEATQKELVSMLS